jgi:hypothetical protein
VRLRALQIFFAALVLLIGLSKPLDGALSSGQRYVVKFSDVDSRAISTADGHVAVLVLTTTEDLTRAHAVRDRVPDYCRGNANYRMITVLRLAERHTQLGRAVVMLIVRHRIDEEAKVLQTRYNARKISRPAREDIYVVTALTVPYRRNSAHKQARLDFTFSFSAGTENYCSSGMMCRALNN